MLSKCHKTGAFGRVFLFFRLHSVSGGRRWPDGVWCGEDGMAIVLARMLPPVGAEASSSEEGV